MHGIDEAARFHGGAFASGLRAQIRVTWSLESELIAQHVPLAPGARITDICCGMGDFAVRLHDRVPGVRVTADLVVEEAVDAVEVALEDLVSGLAVATAPAVQKLEIGVHDAILEPLRLPAQARPWLPPCRIRCDLGRDLRA